MQVIVAVLQFVTIIAIGVLCYGMQAEQPGLRIVGYYTTIAAFAASLIAMGVSKRGGWVGWLHRLFFTSPWEVNLRYLIYMRFQLLLMAAFVLFPVYAVSTWDRLLKNLFVISPLDLFFVTWISLLVALALMVSTDLSYRYSWLRFDDRRLRYRPWLRKGIERLRIIFFAALAGPTVGWAWWFSVSEQNSGKADDGPSVWGYTIWMALGVVAGVLTLALLTWAREKLVRASTPPLTMLLSGKRFARQKGSRPTITSTPEQKPNVLTRMLGVLGVGYIDPRTGRALPGHTLALALMMIVLAAYASVGVVFSPHFPWNHLFPALGYVLILMMLAAWALPAIAFFLDRWRYPTLLTLIGISVLLYSISYTDHYYDTLPVARNSDESESRSDNSPAFDPPPIDSATVDSAAFDSVQAIEAWLGNRESEERERMIVVTASGGGITAAAWTAQVLTGLEADLGLSFNRSLTSISSVSGGSVGTVFYLDGFSTEQARTVDQLQELRTRASASSLRALAWGVAYPDLLRTLVPPALALRPQLDRGWALQESWRKRLVEQATLRDWRQQMRQGKLPAALLNATALESGKQYLLTPLEPLARSGASLPTGAPFRNMHSFLQQHPQRDLDAIVAARLSATFPWITPMARASRTTSQQAYHLADGGYYDNYGIATMVNWMESVLPRCRQANMQRILILHITAWDPEQTATPSLARERGWAYATYGPLTALYNVRSASQLARNEQELELLRRAWSPQGFEIESIRLNLRAEAPLSWKLSPSKIEAINHEWEEVVRQGVVEEIRQFLR